jgi:sulfur transfer complex TusBCD TusB component (DsrH family)
MPLSPTSRLVVSDQQVFTTLGSEAVILGMRDGVYYGLDEVGARVWSLLEAPRPVSELVSALVNEFEVAPDRCTADVLALLEDLLARGLVIEVPVGGDADLS